MVFTIVAAIAEAWAAVTCDTAATYLGATIACVAAIYLLVVVPHLVFWKAVMAGVVGCLGAGVAVLVAVSRGARESVSCRGGPADLFRLP